MTEDFVVIKSVESEMEAHIIAGKLKAHGIETILQKDDCGGTDPTMHAVLGIQIKVRRRDHEDALAIISEGESGEEISPIDSSRTMTPFWILMFLAVGTGLFLSGHAYNPSLIKYGVILLAVGVVLWLTQRSKMKKDDTR